MTLLSCPTGETYSVSKPALIASRNQEMAFIPLLGLVTEEIITVKKSEIGFGGLLTPKTEILNSYNRIFGSGIEIANALIL